MKQSGDLSNHYMYSDYEKMMRLAKANLQHLTTKDVEKTLQEKKIYLESAIYQTEGLRLCGKPQEAYKMRCFHFDMVEHKDFAVYGLTLTEDERKEVLPLREQLEIAGYYALFDSGEFKKVYSLLQQYLVDNLGNDFAVKIDHAPEKEIPLWTLEAINLYGLSALQINNLEEAKKLHVLTNFLLKRKEEIIATGKEDAKKLHNYLLNAMYFCVLFLLRESSYHTAKTWYWYVYAVMKIAAKMRSYDEYCDSEDKSILFSNEQKSFLYYIHALAEGQVQMTADLLEEALYADIDYDSASIPKKNIEIFRYLFLSHSKRLGKSTTDENLEDSMEYFRKLTDKDIEGWSSFTQAIYVVRPGISLD